jgi:hypothetical protein
MFLFSNKLDLNQETRFTILFIYKQKMPQKVLFVHSYQGLQHGVCHFCTFCFMKVIAEKNKKYSFCEV